ncbi:hypothetical protein [Jiangella alkaliphila]|uniref:Cyclic nucleotide-binding domain-containing protein n=1 Tax=Jiangella alkaliphila TaxID=419479 RepID=A0A1H2J816_9ACTN|nr:hypothetical protein [Jiangella alkaliphila]SDU52452.1 hypothetical protein SAMN04488563_2399 [Jiangella alkaliphila]
MTETTKPAEGATLFQKAAAFEAGVWRSLYVWLARRPRVPEPGATPFGYLEPVSLILWVFIIGSAIEVLVVHFIIPWPVVQIIALVLGLWGLIWMLGYAAALLVHPHAAGPTGLWVRNGSTVDIALRWSDIDAIRIQKRTLPESKTVQVADGDDGDVLQIAVSSQLNVHLVLFEPMTVQLLNGPVTFTELRFYADDPKGLVVLAREHLRA